MEEKIPGLKYDDPGQESGAVSGSALVQVLVQVLVLVVVQVLVMVLVQVLIHVLVLVLVWGYRGRLPKRNSQTPPPPFLWERCRAKQSRPLLLHPRGGPYSRSLSSPSSPSSLATSGGRPLLNLKQPSIWSVLEKKEIDAEYGLWDYMGCAEENEELGESVLS